MHRDCQRAVLIHGQAAKLVQSQLLASVSHITDKSHSNKPTQLSHVAHV